MPEIGRKEYNNQWRPPDLECSLPGVAGQKRVI